MQFCKMSDAYNLGIHQNESDVITAAFNMAAGFLERGDKCRVKAQIQGIRHTYFAYAQFDQIVQNLVVPLEDSVHLELECPVKSLVPVVVDMPAGIAAELLVRASSCYCTAALCAPY